jgi:hypothetical protein
MLQWSNLSENAERPREAWNRIFTYDLRVMRT